MIYVDVSTIKPFFTEVEDLDNNGVLSEGDRLRTSDDAFAIADSHVQNLSKLALYLSNVNEQGRQFRLLTDGSETANDYVDYYLAYSQGGSTATLEGMTHLGQSVETYDSDMSTTDYNDATDTSVNLAQIYSATKYAGLDSYAAKRYVRFAAEHDLVVANVRANWTRGFVQENLARKGELERKLERLEKRLND